MSRLLRPGLLVGLFLWASLPGCDSGQSPSNSDLKVPKISPGRGAEKGGMINPKADPKARN